MAKQDSSMMVAVIVKEELRYYVINLHCCAKMELIDVEPHEAREWSDGFLLTWGMSLLVDNCI